MNYIPLSLRVGGSVWYYTLFLNVEIIGSLIRMVAHSIISDLVGELWRNVREKGSQEESDLEVEIDFDGIKLSYPFKIDSLMINLLKKIYLKN